MNGFLTTQDKTSCFGCEACVQVCTKGAITMQEDAEGFRYPVVDYSLCVDCGCCHKVCPYENQPIRFGDNKYTFGGYIKDAFVRDQSTSGGAFSAIVNTWSEENCVVIGAEAAGLEVKHSYAESKTEYAKFRKSKYVQSHIGSVYKDCKRFLEAGKKLLFSGTPCQIAGLRSYLKNTEQKNLLTVEVICNGVPSPLYVRKYEAECKRKYGSHIKRLDYRYKDDNRWDFAVMETELADRKKPIKTDRWFNPFWTIWLNNLMSRPSCYQCPFTAVERSADITLGDLWGVHLYCPELYGKNGGSSLVVCNTDKGGKAFLKAQNLMYGHELKFEDALKYQRPMREHIDRNLNRDEFMSDLRSKMTYSELNKKWAKKPTLKLLFQKYIWGNSQKIALWNLRQKFRRSEK